MNAGEYPIGELVVITAGEYKNHAGVVSWPITRNSSGYVLICSDGKIAGMQTSADDLRLADTSSQGFAQLSYMLLKLSSYVIEQSLLPATAPG